jgi:hypothetical protein
MTMSAPENWYLKEALAFLKAWGVRATWTENECRYTGSLVRCPMPQDAIGLAKLMHETIHVGWNRDMPPEWRNDQTWRLEARINAAVLDAMEERIGDLPNGWDDYEKARKRLAIGTASYVREVVGTLATSEATRSTSTGGVQVPPASLTGQPRVL